MTAATPATTYNYEYVDDRVNKPYKLWSIVDGRCNSLVHFYQLGNYILPCELPRSGSMPDELLSPDVEIKKVFLNQSKYALKTPEILKATLIAQNNYSIFVKAYQQRIDIAGENDTIRGLFEFLANDIKKLDIENITVDTSISKSSVKFFLDLGNGLRSTVKTTKDMAEGGYIAYTIWHRDEMMNVSVIPLDEYCEIIKTIQQKIAEIQ